MANRPHLSSAEAQGVWAEPRLVSSLVSLLRLLLGVSRLDDEEPQRRGHEDRENDGVEHHLGLVAEALAECQLESADERDDGCDGDEEVAGAQSRPVKELGPGHRDRLLLTESRLDLSLYILA